MLKLLHSWLQHFQLDRPRLPARPLHLRSLALRRCHRNISAEAKVLIHDLALTFHRDSSLQWAIQLILHRQPRLLAQGKFTDLSLILLYQAELRPKFSEYSCRSLEIPTCVSIFVSVLGMFCLSSVILFHLMTVPLDCTRKVWKKPPLSSSEV